MPAQACITSYLHRLGDGTYLLVIEEAIHSNWVLVNDTKKVSYKPAPLKLDEITMNAKKEEPIYVLTHDEMIEMFEQQKYTDCEYCNYCFECGQYCHYCKCCDNCGYYIERCECGYNSPSYAVTDDNESFYSDQYNNDLTASTVNQLVRGDKSRTSIRKHRCVYRLACTPRSDLKKIKMEKRKKADKKSKRQIESTKKSSFDSKSTIYNELKYLSIDNQDVHDTKAV
jgi:hypothetical protein